MCPDTVVASPFLFHEVAAWAGGSFGRWSYLDTRKREYRLEILRSMKEQAEWWEMETSLDLERLVVWREKSILAPCWNCFLDLLSIAFVIIILHNGLPQRILPLCLTVKLKCLCSEPCPPIDGRKEKTNTPPCLRLAILGDICKINGLFTLFPPPCHLWSIKEPGIQTPKRWLFWNISLPSSWSAGFLNKIVFLASTPRLSDSLACHVESTASLELVSVWAVQVLRRRVQ